jgi:hypothetical protein
MIRTTGEAILQDMVVGTTVVQAGIMVVDTILTTTRISESGIASIASVIDLSVSVSNLSVTANASVNGTGGTLLRLLQRLDPQCRIAAHLDFRRARTSALKRSASGDVRTSGSIAAWGV